MNNKEYVLQNHTDDLLSTVYVYGLCELCHAIGCAEYCKSPKAPHSCEETFKAWLNMEHIVPLRFPIGTMVEVTKDDATWLGYYNGTRANGTHTVCTYKENVGKKVGEVPQGNTCTLDEIKKVGD